MEKLLPHSQGRVSTFLLLFLFFVSVGKAQTTIGLQNFEASGSTMTYSASGGAVKNGTSGTGDRPASSNFYTSASNGYWINNGTATVTCANVTGLGSYVGKTANFSLASFSVGATNNGADGPDKVTISVSLDGGTTYSDEIEIDGNTNAYWAYSATGVASSTYDGDNTTTVFAPAAGGSRTTDGYSTISINLPDSATQVRIKVTMLNNSANEGWVIDDITVKGFTPTNYYSKSTGNLNTLSTWGTNTDGTGTAPSNFTASNQYFNIRNNATPTIGAAWTVSGSSSKVIVGDGTTATNFTVPSGFAFTGTVDVSANATLTLTNATIPTIGTLATTSTVVYNGSTAQSISAETYGNLTYSGTNTGTVAGDFDIAGNFSCTSGNVNFNNSGTARTFNITGNFSSSTTGNIEFGSGAGSCTINLTGNFSKTNGVMTTTTASANADFNMVGTTQTLQSTNTGTIMKWVDFTIASGSTCSFLGNFYYNGSAGTQGVITVSSGGTLNCGTNILLGTASTTTFVVSAGGTLGVGSTVGITTTGATGNIQSATRTYTAGANYVYNGTSAQVTGNGLTANIPNDLTIDNSTGVTLSAATTISGDLLISSGTLSTSGSNFAMSVGGSWTNNGGFTAGTSTETFTGSAQTIGGSSSTTFGAVVIASGATYTMNSSNTASSLTFAAAAVNSSLSHATGTTFTVNGAVTINQPSANTLNSSWNINAGTATVSGLITFAGANTTTSRVGKIVITTGTLNANGGITFVGSAAATKVIDMSGGAGNLNLKGALTIPAASATLVPGTSSTFSYVDTGAQTVNNFNTGNYYNLAVSGSGVKTFGAVTTITNNFSITLPATVTFPNTTTSSANSLTLGGSGQNSGTWGGTGSGATNINTSYFNATTNGRITITTGTCTTGYWLGGTNSAWNTAANWCGSTIPSSSTDVVIPTGTPFAPSITAITAACKSITINSGATLTLSASASSILNISGDFINNGTLTAGAASSVNFVGTANQVLGGSSTTTFANLTINTGTSSVTVTNSSTAFQASGNLTVTKGNLVLQATNANYNLTGNLSVATTGTLTHNVDWDVAGKQINVAGNIAIDGVYTKGSGARSHVQITAPATKSVHTGTSSLSIFTINTAAAITADGALTVDDNFWAPIANGGSFSTNGQTVIANGSLLVNSGGTLNVNGGSLTIVGGLSIGQIGANGGTVNLSSGTLTTDGITIGEGTTGTTTACSLTQTGGTLQVNGAVTINQPTANTITNSWNINAQTATVTGLITFAGTDVTTSRVGKIVITTGTLNANGGITFVGSNAATKVIDMSGGAGNLNLKGVLTVPAASSTLTSGTTSTFSYVDSGTQTINKFSSGNYNNLSISGAGVKTFAALTAITNKLSIATGSSLNLGTFANTAGTLSLGGSGTAAGLWGTNTTSNPSAATFTNNTFFAATTGSVQVGAGSCSAYNATITGTATICNGGSSTISVTPITGGVSPYKVIYVGSPSGGATVNGYTVGNTISVSPTVTTTYTLSSVTDSFGCTATNLGSAVVTVYATFTSGAINTTGETICNGGTPATTIGSATAASGGDNTITYSWRSSADGYTAAISGATSATYLPPAGLTTTTSYQRYAKDGTCNTTPTVSTGTWTVTVRPAFTSGTINTTGETICNGGIPATTIGSATAASGGDNTITYSWRSSADGYTAAISGATSATYLPPAGLTTTISYQRYAKDGTCNTTPTVSTGTWTVTVRPAFTSGAINTTGETICNGGTPATIIGSATAASGGDNTITYSWRSSADGYTAAISGATSATYLPPAGLTTTTSYRRYAKDGTCNTTPTVSTGTWTVTVNATFTSGAITTTGETICNGGTPATTIGSATAASGGDNTITYSWRSSADGYTAAISGATSVTYLPPAGLTTTTSYRRYAKDGTCNTTPTVSTGTWTVTVRPTFTSGTINNTGETICNGGTPATTIGSATAASGGDNTITYSWRSSADGYTAAISGATSATYLPPAGLTATTSYRRYAKDGTCNTTPTVSTGTWTVTVRPTFTSGTINNTGETICNGGTPATTIGSATAASGGDNTITYSWRSSADGYTAAISGATSATYLPPAGLTATTSYRRYAKDGTCNTTPTVSTGTWTVTVRPLFTSGAINTTGETICNGGTPATTIGSATAASGGDNTITYSWRSSADGYTAAISGATSVTYLPPSGLTTTTSYRRYAKDGTCNTTLTVSTGTWTVTVTANNTAGSASSSPTLCINTALTAITHTTTGATGIGTATGLPTGVTAAWASNTITISGTPSNSGTFNYSIPLTGGCTTVNATGTITVRPAFTSGAIGTSGETICFGGSPTLGINSVTAASGGDGSITYKWQANGVDIPGSNSDTYDPPPGLTVTTTYTRFAKDNTCNTTFTISSGSWVVTVSNTNTWTGSVSTTWGTVGNWSCGYVPTSATDVVIGTGSFYPVLVSDVSIHSLTLNSGTTLKVNSTYDLTVTDAIVNNGTLTFENNSNLVQVNNVSNTGSGSTIVKRNSAALLRLDYTLWSSPVSGQGLYSFSPFTLPNRFYVYNTATNLYSNSVGFSLTGLQYPSPLVSPNGVNGTDSNNVQFVSGKGYLIRLPWDHPTAATVWNGTFTGVANNGNITFAMTTGYNAVGNPYPSRLNVKDFIDGNTNISGPLYLWRKTNDNNSTSYATLTKTAYVANGAIGGDTGTGYFNAGNEANWVLNVGQGFIVNATSNSNLTFTNSMRRSSNADQFFRASQTTVNTANSGLYWLNLNASTGIYSQMAVGYSSEGTLAEDRGIDGRNINQEFYLTSLIGADAYSIQGRPDFQDTDIVPLSYKVSTAGNYTITIDHAVGVFSGGAQSIYLKDNLTNTINNLSAGAYAFTSAAGTFTNRFEIIYQSQLGTEHLTFSDNNVTVYTHNDELVINTENIIMATVKVFDVRGRLLQERKNINASHTSINAGLANEVLLVQITSEDGITVTKKVVR
ncbi:G8 domain-containing protein [Flavobacterium sp. N1994]|uniref:G8 domain-containing protein n=1 Tax=Flavobacterium sp. N1994 TaxID=2986827 RepID=UPI002223E210|nr:hypothetical protein [Flavobacterium sp. N1994]